MRILFFDDDHARHEQFRQMCHEAGVQGDICGACTIAEARLLLSTRSFDWAFLDHDLDGQVMVRPGEHTGLAVAQMIAAMVPERRPGRVVVHTMNPEGERAMLAAFYTTRFRRVQTAYFGGAEFKSLVAEMAKEVT